MSLDLDAYLARVGYAGDREPTTEVLEKLHLAHATHVPFENLDIQLGRPIRLDLESLQAKLVHGERPRRLGPRTHMLLRVDVDDTHWIADVGFGGQGLLKPVPLVGGRA